MEKVNQTQTPQNNDNSCLKLTPDNLAHLMSGFCTEVDGFSHYHFSKTTFFLPKLANFKTDGLSVCMKKKKKQALTIRRSKELNDKRYLTDTNVILIDHLSEFIDDMTPSEQQHTFQSLARHDPDPIALLPYRNRKLTELTEMLDSDEPFVYPPLQQKLFFFLATQITDDHPPHFQRLLLSGDVELNPGPCCNCIPFLERINPEYMTAHSEGHMTYTLCVVFELHSEHINSLSLQFCRQQRYCQYCHMRYFKVICHHSGEYTMEYLASQIDLHLPTYDFFTLCFQNRPFTVVLTTFPTAHSDHIKENTKRNNKTHRSPDETRLKRLSQSDSKFAKDLKHRISDLQTQHRQQANRKYEQKETQKLIDKCVPQAHFDVNLNVFNYDLFQKFEELVAQLPPETSGYMDWLDVFASCYVLLYDPLIVAKYAAIRQIYKSCRIKGVTIAIFTSFIVYLLYKIGFLQEKDYQIHAEAHSFSNIPKEPFVCAVTLFLMYFYGSKPHENHVAHVVNNIGRVPLNARGIDYLIECFSSVKNYVTTQASDAPTLESEISHISERVMFYNSEDGLESILTDNKCFAEITDLLVRSQAVISHLPPNSTKSAAFRNIAFQLNGHHRKVQLSPVGGHSFRKRPCVIHLFGEPGIGKSFLINLFSADALQTVFELDGCTPQQIQENLSEFQKFIYFRPVGMKYQTNYNTSFSRIYVCDDANQLDPKSCPDTIPFTGELIHLNNNHDHLLNVAELENKRLAKFRSDLVIATDNTQSPDLSNLQSSKAFFRRIDFQFHVSLKPNFVHIVNGIPVFNEDLANNDTVDHSMYIFRRIVENKISNVELSYEQVVEKLQAKLRAIHHHHHRDSANLKNYATRKYNVKYSAKSEEVFIPALLSSSEDSDSPQEKETEIFTQLPPTFKSKRHSRASSSGGNSSKLKAHADDPSPSAEFPSPDEFPSTSKVYDSVDDLEFLNQQRALRNSIRISKSEKAWTWYHTFKVWFLMKFFFLLDFPSSRSRFRDRSNFQKRIVTLVSISGLALAAFAVYKIAFKKRKKSYVCVPTCPNKSQGDARPPELIVLRPPIDPQTESQNPPQNQHYDKGDATKTKSPPQSSKPIKSAPLFQSIVDRTEIIADPHAFYHTPSAEVASNLAYSVAKFLCSNAYLIQFTNKKTNQYSNLRGFFVKDSTFVTNRHFLNCFKTDEINGGTLSLASVFHQHLNIPTKDLKYAQIMHEDESESSYDVMSINFGKKIPSHLDICSKFAGNKPFISEHEVQHLMGCRIMVITLMFNAEIKGSFEQLRFQDKGAWYLEITHTKIHEVLSEPLPMTTLTGMVYSNRCINYPMQSMPGYCGSVVIANGSEYGGRILGIHMAGYHCKDSSYGQVITQQMIDALIDDKTTSHVQLINHDIKTIVDDTFQAVATIPHTLRAPIKSKIRKSLFHNKIFQTTKAPAILGKGPSGNYVVNLALKKYLGASLSLISNQESLAFAHLNFNFRPERKLKTFDIETAIRGIEGSEYIQPINRSSSAGYPFNVLTKKRGKTEFLGENDDFIYDHPLVLSRVAKYCEDSLAFKRPECYFITTSKDELRTLDKIAAEKTRSFAAAPLDYVIIFRQHYLDVFSWLMENKISNSSLVGINPYSDDWDYLVKRMLQISSAEQYTFIAGDHSNFDGRLNRDLLWVVYNFLEQSYLRKSNRITESLWLDIVASRQLFGNTAIMLTRGQPSGNPGTALINTLYNSSLMYVCLFEVLEQIGTTQSFSLQEELAWNYYGAYYGDDNILVVSQKCADILHPSLIQKKMLDYGHIYTTDAKDGSEFEYRKLSEISIIKRKFLYDPQTRVWFAPLEIPSILEPLNWDKIDYADFGLKEEQMRINSRIAIREFAMHPKDIFEEWRAKIVNLCVQHEIRLSPDCYYEHDLLRVMIKRGDNQLSFFHNDNLHGEKQFDFLCREGASPSKLGNYARNFSIVENDKGTKTKSLGKCIYTWDDDLDSSPIELSPAQNHMQIYPTAHVDSRISSINENEGSDLPFKDPTQEVTTGAQIVGFSTTEAPIVESIPSHQPLPDSSLSMIRESRSHNIRDILCREYAFESFTIPIGGVVGEILKTWSPFQLLLSQPNVFAKLEGFYNFRTDVFLRLEMTVQPYTSGGVMLSYYPDISPLAVTNRSLNRLQLSQTPNVQISLPTTTTPRMRCPWVSPWLSHDLPNNIGDLGTVILSRLTPSAIGTVNVVAYISADPDTICVEYPTLAPIPTPPSIVKSRTEASVNHLIELGYDVSLSTNHIPQAHVKLEGQKQAKQGVISGILNSASHLSTICSGIPVIGSAASTLAPILSLGSNIAGAFGFSKTISEKPVKAVKWVPGDGHLTNEGNLPVHEFTINKGCAVESTSGPFGSRMDEMSVEAICRVPNLIDDFMVTTSQLPGTIVYSTPANLCKFTPVGVNGLSPSHQFWISQLFNQWAASLLFDFKFYGNHFHNSKLRFIFAPGDSGTFSVGSIMPFDSRNLATSQIVQFTGDNTSFSMRVEPASVSTMKLVPSPWSANINSRLNLENAMSDTSVSYGTLYVCVETPLQASGTVSPSVFMTVSFSAADVSLTNPLAQLNFLPFAHSCPQAHVNTLGPTQDDITRSERIENPATQVVGNSTSIDYLKVLKECAGDKCVSVKNLCNAFQFIYNDFFGANSIMVNPFFFNISSSGDVDVIDYLAVGYAFWKGSMMLRVASEAPLLIYSYQAFITPLSAGFSGNAPSSRIVVHVGTGIRTGTRTIPVFTSEGCMDYSVPYYQTYHMARTAVDPIGADPPTAYRSGNNPMLLGLFNLNQTTSPRHFYRATGDDFRFGFLTSLPVFTLQSNPIFT